MCEIPTLFTDSGQKNVCMKYDKEATSSTSVDGEILGAVIQKVTNHKQLFDTSTAFVYCYHYKHYPECLSKTQFYFIS